MKISNFNVSKKQIKVLGKRNKERIIPLIDSTIMILNKYLVLRSEITSNQEFLFITNSGKVVYEKLIYRIINKYFNNISTKVKKSPHIIRHSYLDFRKDLNSVKDVDYLLLTEKGTKIYETLVYRVINNYFSKV